MSHVPPPLPNPYAPALVTGGTGFLGRRLVERLLEAGRPVTVLGRNSAADFDARGVNFISTALDHTPAVMMACRGITTVFHLAARVGVWGDFMDFHRTNILGTRSLLAACRANGVRRLVYTSTPSVVYNGRDLAGVNESLPLTTACPSPYPLTKAVAERDVLDANRGALATVALRPHLIWGIGDPHLVPRVLARARAGRLPIIGSGRNRVDMVHVENAVDAHLLAERALASPPEPLPPAERLASTGRQSAAGRAYFITNGEPVLLWDWINELLRSLGERPVKRRLPLGLAKAIGGTYEFIWRELSLRGEPPLTRFVATELAKDHWFDQTAARRDLGYVPRISMAEGTEELVAWLKSCAAAPPRKA